MLLHSGSIAGTAFFSRLVMNTALRKNRSAEEHLLEKVHPIASDRSRLSLELRKRWFCLTHWETWDWRLKYVFIIPAWLWFCLRARSFWFFTASNPSLTFGGFEGQSKREMYDQLPPGTYPRSVYIPAGTTFENVQEAITQSALQFPLAVKPDVGKMGLMFRCIHSPEELRLYHSLVSWPYIIQEFVEHTLEVSVFYYRMPDQMNGTITGFIRKDYLEVTGNGQSTLWDLIVNHPRARFRLQEMRAKHYDRLYRILEKGERYCLSPALNLSRGGKLVSLEHEKDSRLLKVFDGISQSTGNYYYGRYDVRCRSIEDLKEGKFFSILEYNGSGAEPHHVYGNGNTLWQACKILVAHWNMLYKISAANHRRGIPYWKFKRGWRFLKQARSHLADLRRADTAMPVH